MKENKYIKEITSVFQIHNNDRYECHKIAKDILKRAAADKEFLFEIIRYNLSDPEFVQKKRHYSTLSLPIINTPDFNMVINVFPPLPDRRTDISFQSIHQHGNLLLTTASVFGPGYESIVYKKNYGIDPATFITKMEKEKIYTFKSGEVEFIDAFTPHVVFYPPSISATLALWSNKTKTNSEGLKKLSVLQKFKDPIKKILKFIGLSKSFNINEIIFFDFYPEKGKLYALKERLVYNFIGSNDNFIQNIFHFIQSCGFQDENFLLELQKNDFISPFTKTIIEKFIKKEPIKDDFLKEHLNIPKVNLSKKELLGTVM